MGRDGLRGGGDPVNPDQPIQWGAREAFVKQGVRESIQSIIDRYHALALHLPTVYGPEHPVRQVLPQVGQTLLLLQLAAEAGDVGHAV